MSAAKTKTGRRTVSSKKAPKKRAAPKSKAKKKAAKRTKATAITCQAEHAGAVFIAGTFNDWNPEATPMKRAPSGRWRVALQLPPGRHEFKFIVDGEWCCAPACHGDEPCPQCVPNEHGTMNRVLEVAKK